METNAVHIAYAGKSTHEGENSIKLKYAVDERSRIIRARKPPVQIGQPVSSIKNQLPRIPNHLNDVYFQFTNFNPYTNERRKKIVVTKRYKT